ncbi:MAG: 4Fe-4S dicluster domain-containing protein [Bacillota bacterium]
MSAIFITKMDEGFTSAVSRESDENLFRCYQCGKCTAGCPLSPDMDLAPNRVIRLVQLGMKEDVLKSQAIWLCAFCSTCTVRCPQSIDLARVMETLRIMARREGLASSGRSRRVRLFGDNFLDSVKRFGRMFEFGTMVGYNLRSGNPLKEGDTGLGMLRRGKLKFIPEKPEGMDEISSIFEKVRLEEERER